MITFKKFLEESKQHEAAMLAAIQREFEFSDSDAKSFLGWLLDKTSSLWSLDRKIISVLNQKKNIWGEHASAANLKTAVMSLIS